MKEQVGYFSVNLISKILIRKRIDPCIRCINIVFEQNEPMGQDDNLNRMNFVLKFRI